MSWFGLGGSSSPPPEKKSTYSNYDSSDSFDNSNFASPQLDSGNQSGSFSLQVIITKENDDVHIAESLWHTRHFSCLNLHDNIPKNILTAVF